MEGVPREAEEPREGGHDRARRQVHPPERFVHQPHRGVPPCGRPRPRAREPQVGGVARHREARDEGARGIGRHPRAGRVRGSRDRGEDRRHPIRGGERPRAELDDREALRVHEDLRAAPTSLRNQPHVHRQTRGCRIAVCGSFRRRPAHGGPRAQGPSLLRRVSIPSGVAIPSAAAFANPLGPRSRRRVLSPQPLNRPWASSCFVSTFSYDQLLTRAKKALPAALSSGERFQVPAPDVVIEGKTTILRNFEDIVGAIRRDPDMVLTYLLRELGTAGAMEGRRVVFKSKVTAQQLEERIKSYVDAYVLCQECGRPDTRLVKEDRIAMLECDACGARRPVKAVKKAAKVEEAPLVEGKVYELMIQDIGKKGDGIAKLDKYVIYVPGTAKGAIVKVFIEKIAGTVAFGRVTRE